MRSKGRGWRVDRFPGRTRRGPFWRERGGLTRPWDSKRTKTNAPINWLAHNLMGRNGLLPARAGLPKRRVGLTITLPPRQRAWDADALWKSLLDGLTACGAIQRFTVSSLEAWAALARLVERDEEERRSKGEEMGE